MNLVLDAASWVLLSLGGLFVFVGGLGAVRLPDLYTRMHAASVTDSMGSLMMLTGIMLQAGFSLATVKLAAILLFLLLTSPTASNALASAALLAGERPSGPLPWESAADASDAAHAADAGDAGEDTPGGGAPASPSASGRDGCSATPSRPPAPGGGRSGAGHGSAGRRSP